MSQVLVIGVAHKVDDLATYIYNSPHTTLSDIQVAIKNYISSIQELNRISISKPEINENNSIHKLSFVEVYTKSSSAIIGPNLEDEKLLPVFDKFKKDFGGKLISNKHCDFGQCKTFNSSQLQIFKQLLIDNNIEFDSFSRQKDIKFKNIDLV